MGEKRSALVACEAAFSEISLEDLGVIDGVIGPTVRRELDFTNHSQARK